MTIQDTVGNVLITQSSPMIGYVPVDIQQELSLSIYKFIIQIIRTEDQNNGNKLLERLLNGCQQRWQSTDANIKNLTSLWSISDIDNEYLKYLKWIVGWTSELDSITNGLDNLTLRRLISASIPFWKKRGVEDAIKDVLQLATGSRLRIWNWFDFKFIVEETVLSEDNQGRDPWMLSLPGAPGYVEKNYEIRIVDDGNIDRTLVVDLAKLTRPSGERVTISYIDFLDLFTIENDTSQWLVPDLSGGGIMNILNGYMNFGNDSGTISTYTNVPNTDWDEIVFSTRLKFETATSPIFRMIFNYVDENNFYYIRIYPYGGITTDIHIRKVKDGIVTTIDSDTINLQLFENVWYMFRVTCTNINDTKEIKFFIDSVEYLSHIDTSLTINSGKTGFRVTNMKIYIDEVEIFELPLETDFIDIN